MTKTATRKRNAFRTIAKIALVALAAYALSRWIDWTHVGTTLATISLGALLLAIVLAWVDRVVMGVKWRQLVRAAGGSLRVRDAVSIYFQASFTDHVLPNVVTSEALRLYRGRQLGIPAPLLLSSMAIERIVGALVAITLAGIGLLTVAAELEPKMRSTYTMMVIAAAIFGMLVIIAAWWTPLHRVTGRVVRKWLPPAFFALLGKVSQALVAYRAQPAALAVNLLMALGENLLGILTFYVIGRGVGIELPMVPFFAVIAVTSLVRRVAMYIEGRGLGEGSAIAMFALLGVDRNAAVALTFAHYAVWLVASLPGAFLLYRSGINIRDVTRNAAIS